MHRKIYLISFLTAFFIALLFGSEALYSQDLYSGGNETKEGCEQTISWKPGTIDSRFRLNHDSLTTIMREVADLWEGAAGYPVIIYDPMGDVELNLYYTDQQKYTDSEQELNDKINKLRQVYYSKNVMYQRQKRQFENEERLINNKQLHYNDVVGTYNETINRIQTAGVRSRELNNKLKRLKRDVEILEHELEKMRDNLQEQEEELSVYSDELNRRADTINELIYQYQKRFSSWKTFYQGAYLNVAGKRKINIYQFDDIERLTLVLAHEFGHALGLTHVGNPKSVMYYLTDRQDTRNLKLSEEDIRAFQYRCNL